MSVDNIDEVRMQASENLKHYQEETKRWQDKRIKHRGLDPTLIKGSEAIFSMRHMARVAECNEGC